MIYGYCRVSTKGQAKDGNSLEAQEKAILERYTDAKIYTEAYTGTIFCGKYIYTLISAAFCDRYVFETILF